MAMNDPEQFTEATDDEDPDEEAARTWFARMQARYPEPRPEDPEAIAAWASRGLAWARRVDPRGADAALEALIVESGLAQPVGMTREGKIVFKSRIYERDDEHN
jgi:hypothetical protein